MKITGNVFVVTGAGNGIGRDVALELLSRGARVAGVDVSPAALADTAALAGAGTGSPFTTSTSPIARASMLFPTRSRRVTGALMASSTSPA